MPFTFSHPAIVLPLLRINERWKIFSATGLILGSIIPDFESFIRFDQHKAYSHTWFGIFWFDLPLAIIFAYIYHNIVRDPLIKNLPGGIGSKFLRFIGFNWNSFLKGNFIVVIFSIIVGIASHLLWDAFTHLNIADPNATDSETLLGPVRLYLVLQYVSSVVGLAIVGWYIFNFKNEPGTTSTSEEIPDRPPAITLHKSKTRYWTLLSAIAILTVGFSAWLIDESINVILLIEISISGLLIGLIITPVIQMFLFSKER